MKQAFPPVLGVTAPPARATFAGALWLAVLLSIPVGLIGLGVELCLRWLL